MKRFLQKLMIPVLVFTPALAVPLVAHAEDDTTTTMSQEERRAMLAERKEGRLSDVKKAICEKRAERVKQIMTKAAENGAKHLGVFDRGLTRIQEFYVKKELTVANYDALVDAAADKKAAAQTAIDAVKDGVEFDCSGDNPVGKVNVFIDKVKAMRQALKDYRSAIKDVLHAVKQSAEAAEATAEGGDQ